VNKTQIEWVKNPDGSQGYTWNPITGCLNGCEYCYARKLANTRLKNVYLLNNSIPAPDEPFYPRFWEERLQELIPPLAQVNYERYGYQCRKFEPYRKASRKPKGIFVCDMGDLFGIGVPEEWTRRVLLAIGANPQDRFYLLTKQPQRLPEFSPFPENAWVGVTVCNDKMLDVAVDKLEDIQAKIKFISFEPLLERLTLSLDYAFYYSGISQVIIGACTGTYSEMTRLCALNNMSYTDKKPFGKKWTLQPRIEWVRQIVEAADKAGVKVFLKDNLKPLFEQTYGQDIHSYYYHNGLRQEMPNPERVAIPERI